MAFLTRTRIRKIASGTIDAKVLLSPPTTFRTSAVGQVVETVPEAMALVPAGQRPPESDWWQYDLLWEVGAAVVPTIRGVTPDSTILWFDCDFWETDALRLGGNAPTRRDTFGYQFTVKNVSNATAAIRSQIETSLIDAHFRPGAVPDERDLGRITTQDPAHDPLGLCTRPAITAYNQTPVDLPPRFRTRSG